MLSLVELFDLGESVSDDLDFCQLDVSTARVEVQMRVGNHEELVFVGFALKHSDETQIAFHVHLGVAFFLWLCLVVEGHAEGVHVGEALRVIVGRGTVFAGGVRFP